MSQECCKYQTELSDSCNLMLLAAEQPIEQCTAFVLRGKLVDAGWSTTVTKSVASLTNRVCMKHGLVDYYRVLLGRDVCEALIRNDHSFSHSQFALYYQCVLLTQGEQHIHVNKKQDYYLGLMGRELKTRKRKVKGWRKAIGEDNKVTNTKIR